jgi:hypothetical protein
MIRIEIGRRDIRMKEEVELTGMKGMVIGMVGGGIEMIEIGREAVVIRMNDVIGTAVGIIEVGITEVEIMVIERGMIWVAMIGIGGGIEMIGIEEEKGRRAKVVGVRGIRRERGMIEGKGVEKTALRGLVRVIRMIKNESMLERTDMIRRMIPRAPSVKRKRREIREIRTIAVMISQGTLRIRRKMKR